MENNLPLPLRFIWENTKGKTTIFDTNIVAGPSVFHILGDHKGRIHPIEQVLDKRIIDNEQEMREIVEYYQKVDSLMREPNALVTLSVQKELKKMFSYGLGYVLFIKDAGALKEPIKRLALTIDKKNHYIPTYNIRKGFFHGIITERMNENLSQADLEGIAAFFELREHTKNLALVSTDKKQIEALERNAQNRNIEIETMFYQHKMRKNYVVLCR